MPVPQKPTVAARRASNRRREVRVSMAVVVIGLALLALDAAPGLAPTSGPARASAGERVRRAATRTFRRPVVTYRLGVKASGVEVVVIATADVASGRMAGTLRVPDSEAGDRVVELQAVGHRLFLRSGTGSWQETDLLGVLGTSSESEAPETLALVRPQDLLGLLRGSAPPDQASTEPVDGIATTRYATRVDVALLTAGAGQLPDAQALGTTAARLGADGFEAEVWIDANGKVRRLEVRHANHASGPLLELEILAFQDRLDADVPADPMPLPAGEATSLLRGG